MSYVGGVIEKAIDAVVDQLEGHQVSGGKLDNLKHILIGSRKFDDGGWNTPLLVINPTSFSSVPKTTSSYVGENLARITLECRLLHAKLVQADKVSLAENVLYDGLGNGAINLYQDFVYALMFSHGGATSANFTPSLGLKLNKMPMPDFRIEDTENYIEIVSNVIIEYIYTYSAIADSTI